MNKFKKILPWFLLVFLMLIIYYLSNQPVGESRDLTKKTLIIAADFIDRFIPIERFKTKGIVTKFRKSAHYFLYLAMALIVMFGLKSIGMKGKKRIITTLLVCMVFAISDEIHQLFVEGRGAEIGDVVIDTLGALSGIVIYQAFASFRKRRRAKQTDKREMIA